jgi:hypothetical protein
MPYTLDNILITTATGDAYLATDWGTSGTGFTQSHVPISKLAYGDENTTTRVTSANPLPTYLYGSTGNSVSITGYISGSSNPIEIINDIGTYLQIAGTTFSNTLVGITGTIQGFTNAYPVGITGTISIGNIVAVYGISGATAIGITGGRFLNKNTDTITVHGNVGISGGLNLTSATDSIAVYGADYGEKVLTRLYASDGATIGYNSDALKVYLTNSGITFNVTVSPTIGVTNEGTAGLMVRGTGNTADYPVIVKGQAANGSIEITSSSNLPVTVQNGSLVIDDADILTALGKNGDLYTSLSALRTNTSAITSISEKISSGVISVKITENVKPSAVRSGKKSATTSASQLLSTNVKLNSGVHIKSLGSNTDIVYIGSSSLNSAGTDGYPLEPGESIFIEINNLSNIYVRSVTGTQSIHYVAT